MISDFVLQHLANWLETVHRKDREKVKEGILTAIARDPELVTYKSWPDIRKIAEYWEVG